MLTKNRLSSIFLMILLAATISLIVREVGAGQWQSAVDQELLAAFESSDHVELLVLLDEQADLSPAGALTSKSAKGAFVYQTLLETAARTQPDLLAELSAGGIEHQPFWIVNAVWVRSDRSTLRSLAMREDVKQILSNPKWHLDVPISANDLPSLESNAAVEWNIELIGAPQLWASSIDGRGVVIGGQDTGYDWQHAALKDQYRGWDGLDADHNYNWHDAIHSGGGICGPDSPEPCDDHGHGTHTMGTMAGDDGGSNKIGVAPGARWIGCRNMDRGVGTPATYIECFQWFIAPTDIDGENADPAMAPHIINNSWKCPPSEGCTDPGILREAVEAVRAAGILTVQSAGNSGSHCATIDTPAAIYDASFTVGATTSDDLITGFSSRGPVLVDGSQRLKPDVVAPGYRIRSSAAGGGYVELSGTSMASPHVAGMAALLISANPKLAGQVDRLEQLIQASATRKTSDQSCSGFPGSEVPNAVYGYGRIDAITAVRLALGPRVRLIMIFNQSHFGPLDEAAGGRQ